MSTRKRVLSVLLIAALAVAIAGAARAPSARGQGSQPAAVEFTAYEGNPILEKGTSGSWDSLNLWDPVVVFYGGLYHMFYTATTPGWSTFEIGYATSEDGLAWEKYSGNPVFQADGTGFDADAAGVGAVLVDGDTWVLYYGGQTRVGVGGPIGRATAPAPTGPWTRSEDPVLTLGSAGEWDAFGTGSASVITTGEGYAMYYLGLGVPITSEKEARIGMATSLDGITWTKYDDPATTEPPYAESDPVLQIGLEGWTMDNLYQSSVQKTAAGWEMFYTEKGYSSEHKITTYRIGYAFSDDGIRWTKYDGFPILTYEDDPAAPFAGGFVAGSFIVRDSTYYLYYDYHWSSRAGIGVATGTVTWE